jgi:phosphatidylglycerophosphate synthase
MQLHRTTGKPDWADTTPAQRNISQRLAAATSGIVTPGNLTTALGFAAVLYGLWLISGQHYIVGGAILAFGRLCDIADGWLAESTHTKSPLGELLDASIDKIGTVLTIIVYATAHVAPLWLLTALLLPHVIISVITFVQLQRNRKIHPSRIGKLSMAAAWVSLVGLLIARAISGTSFPEMGADGLAILSVILGLYAAVGYARQRD